MRNSKSDKIASLCQLVLSAWEKNLLKKVVLSKPNATDEVKSILSPKLISGVNALQLETFSKDNKAYHRNIREDFESELEKLFLCYAQINVITLAGNCQYMCSKGGKETLVDFNKLSKIINSSDSLTLEASTNNKKKNYILNGDEDFLKKLGISDESGRIRDKMQAKYRQINKFLENIEAILEKLPKNNINIYDLCCGKSYLSFAVFHYFTNVLGKSINMVCIDLKSDVIEYCSNVAKRLGFDKMEFICMDINEYQMQNRPHLVISLHACDIATDIVLNKASQNGADVILSTPCCHHELNHTLNCEVLEFVSRHSMLRQKMCDALTDALRLMKLESEGYKVDALELIDPEDTPKNILLRAIRKKSFNLEKAKELKEKYEQTKAFLLGK